MSFIETPRFPERISYGAIGGPGYQTDIVSVRSGNESRNINWTQARCRWDVSQAMRSYDDFEPVKHFFRAMKGRGHGFRFKDFSDFEATAAEGILTVIVTNTTWQMYKRYTAGSLTEDRKILKPVSGSITLTGGGTYSINYTTGVVTRSAGANPTSWAGEFDVPARFDTDEMRGVLVSRDMMEWESIPIVEIRVP